MHFLRPAQTDEPDVGEAVDVYLIAVIEAGVIDVDVFAVEIAENVKILQRQELRGGLGGGDLFVTTGCSSRQRCQIGVESFAEVPVGGVEAFAHQAPFEIEHPVVGPERDELDGVA